MLSTYPAESAPVGWSMSRYKANPECALVTAVIPTRGRRELLGGAIASALRQTWLNMEVVVVVDGPDSLTAEYLETLTDPRLRVVFLERQLGGSDARNAGVRAARGEWIALLDDDDEWLPEKIERQMRAAHAMADWFPVISCRLIAQSTETSRVLPFHAYDPSQPLSEFLFCRSSLRDPGGMMQCSTLLAPRELLLAVPFQSGLPMHQDWDWLVRVASYKGVAFTMVRQPLSIWRVEDNRATVGRKPAWRTSLGWIRASRDLVSPRAFSWFVAIQCGWRAQKSHASTIAKLALLRAFLLEGKPEFRSLLSFFFYAFVPGRFRRRLRKGLWQTGSAAGSGSGLHLVPTHPTAAPILRKSSI